MEKHKEALDAAYEALIKELKRPSIAADRVQAIATAINVLKEINSLSMNGDQIALRLADSAKRGIH